MRNASSSLLPDLGARGLHVRLDVLLVLILVGHDVLVALRLGVGFGQIDGAVAQPRCRTQLVGDNFEVGTSDFEEHLLFERNFVGHDGQQAMAPRAGHAGKANARVAGGRARRGRGLQGVRRGLQGPATGPRRRGP